MTLRAPASLVFLLAAATTGACATGEEAAPVGAPPPRWEYDPGMVFPGDGSLARPEDGVALPDGALLVADQVHGLRRVDPDGRSAPFGEMVAAGYLHHPPTHPGGANGVSLEPDGTHALVTDVFGSAIYRVNVASGATEVVYRHPYGINAAIRDSHGAIWFTQSARNGPEDGEGPLWAAIDTRAADGALYRLGMTDGRPSATADLLVDSLRFTNGIALDEARGVLYVSEIMASRVWRYRVDVGAGRLLDRSVFVDSVGVDNLELDAAGRLWMAVPIGNTILVVDPETGERHVAFSAQSPVQQERLAEVARRAAAGESILPLFTPELWAPLPGFVTGIILTPDGGPVYLAGLGNALIRLPR
jgi:sugar lactone lactonase YvrE